MGYAQREILECFFVLTKSSSAAGCLDNNLATKADVHTFVSTYNNEQLRHQLQDALDVNLATQAHVHTCISTYNKVIISCNTY